MMSSRPSSSRLRFLGFVETYRLSRSRGRGDVGATQAAAPPGITAPSPASERASVRRYLRWLLPHWRTIALVFGLSITVEGLTMVEPLFMRFIVDHVLLDTSGDVGARIVRLNTAGVTFLVVIVVGRLVNTFRNDRQHLMSARMRVSLRRSLFARMLQLPLSRLEGMKTGGMLSRLTGDVDVTSGFLQNAVVLPGMSLIRLLIASGVLLALNWRLAVAVLAVLPGLVLASFVMTKRVRPIYRAIRKDAEEVDGRAGEAFSGIRVVRMFHREARELLDYMRGQHTMLRKEMFAYRREILVWLAWGLLLAGFNVVILWYGGYLTLRGRASVGDIVAFQWYAVLLLNPVLNLINAFSEMHRSHAVMERVFDILDMDEDKPDRPGAREAPRAVREIRFEHVEFAYRPGRPVVYDLDVSVPGGAMVALVGRSGAGKTTVVDLVARFHDPTRGHILLNGNDIRDFRVRSYRDLFAVVQQHVFLFDGPVRDNISYARPGASIAEVEDAARRANAHDFIERLPEGYDTRVGERGVKLSGGQQQRLAIARAFLKEPALLIMDEATSNLDTESEQLIQASMKLLMASRTTFVIAHRLSTIRRADLILVLDNGRVVERGTHEELMRSGGAYHGMVVRQMTEAGRREEVGTSRRCTCTGRAG